MSPFCQIITEKDKNYDLRLNQLRNTTTEESKEFLENFVKNLYQNSQIKEPEKYKEVGYKLP